MHGSPLRLPESLDCRARIDLIESSSNESRSSRSRWVNSMPALSPCSPCFLSHGFHDHSASVTVTCGFGDMFRFLAERLSQFCEVKPEEEVTGHALLQKLHEERDREIALAKAKEAERIAKADIEAKAWEAEMIVMKARRDALDEENLEKDCLAYFATGHLLLEQNEDLDAQKDSGPQRVESIATVDAGADGNDSETETRPQVGELLETWLEERLTFASLNRTRSWSGNGPVRRRSSVIREENLERFVTGCGGSCSSTYAVSSFGQLPSKDCLTLAESLAEVLKRSMDEAQATIKEAESSSSPKEEEPQQIEEQLERLLCRYSAENPEPALDMSPSTIVANTIQKTLYPAAYLEALEGHRKRCADVRERVLALIPCLEGDLPSTRLVTALAVLDVGSELVGRSTPETLSDLPLPFRYLSTADICWGLCSEKKSLIFDQMLPSIEAKGRWTWSEVRKTGLVWWLLSSGDEGLKLLDSIVTKMAQSSMNKLRRSSVTWSSETLAGSGSVEVWGPAATEDSNVARRLAIDEAVFWSVLLGANATKLQVLMRTGILKEPTASGGKGGLITLLTHPRIGEATFLRKNAFRLLQLHRYHLAAALFLLSNNHDEAARVVGGQMRDLQLAMVVARHRPEVLKPLLLDSFQELPLERDQWLRFLLAYHAGDVDLAQSCVEASQLASENTGPESWDPSSFTRSVSAMARSLKTGNVPLFDGVLRLAPGPSSGLVDVAHQLIRPIKKVTSTGFAGESFTESTHFETETSIVE